MFALQKQTPAIISVDKESFLPCQVNDKIECSLQIAEYLKKILALYVTAKPHEVHLPSVMFLAGFFHRPLIDVLEGLWELKKQHYDYVMTGLDTDIVLYEPFAHHEHDPNPEEFFPRKTV